MDAFIARENVRRFREQLNNCTDVRQRATLKQLLLEHEKQLSEIDRRMSTENRSRPREH